jgi:hypothetical protein
MLSYPTMSKKIYARRRANRYYFLAMFILILLVCIFYLMSLIFLTYMLFIALGMMLAIILMDGLGIILPKLSLKHRTWGRGATAEETVGKYLKEMLEPGNLVVNDIKISKYKGNIDHLVIGKHGIFAIETKTNKGSVTCDGDIWMNERFDNDETRYSDDIRNPSKGAKANAKELCNFLKEDYPQLPVEWVNAVVVFVETKLNIKNEPTDCKITESPEELIKHIKEQPERHISVEDLYNLKELFRLISKESVLT